MKNRASSVILVIILLAGLSLLLYPSFADFWNSKTQSRVISDYESTLHSLSKEDYSAYFLEAYAYNEKLRALPFPLMDHKDLPGYEEALRVGDQSIMGYITIDKIHVQLPIYHGTSDSVLNVGVGHMKGSSLPSGENSTHAVLSAHRGLPSAKLFTNLDQLVEGDRFFITVFDTLFTYEVDQIRIILPDQLEELFIEEDQTLCTLMTCTPYGINTHRLLVRGHLVENDKPPLYISAEAYEVDSLLVVPIVAIPILLILLLLLLLKPKKRKQDMNGGLFDENKKSI